jgi:hypothetical protein
MNHQVRLVFWSSPKILLIKLEATLKNTLAINAAKTPPVSSLLQEMLVKNLTNFQKGAK